MKKSKLIQLFIDEYEARHAAMAALEEMERQRDCAIIALRQCEASFEQLYQDSIKANIDSSRATCELHDTVHNLQDENSKLRKIANELFALRKFVIDTQSTGAKVILEWVDEELVMSSFDDGVKQDVSE